MLTKKSFLYEYVSEIQKLKYSFENKFIQTIANLVDHVNLNFR